MGLEPFRHTKSTTGVDSRKHGLWWMFDVTIGFSHIFIGHSPTVGGATNYMQYDILENEAWWLKTDEIIGVKRGRLLGMLIEGSHTE